jgi:hypothetical protein
VIQCCIEDERRSFGTGFQELVSNRREGLGLRVLVVSVTEKARLRSRQVRVKKMNESKPLMKCREVINGVKTGRQSLARDKSREYLIIDLGGVRHEGGMIFTQASIRNVGTCRSDAKGEAQMDDTMRARVPMLSTGTEQPVVVMMSAQRQMERRGLRCSGFTNWSTVKAGGTNE